ncbi:MAG: 5-formyltetrahydrofolate cyclo-ligase [Pseudomonadota bacterium]
MLGPISLFSGPKDVIRLRLKADRRRLSENAPLAPQHAAAQFLRALDPSPDRTIALYFPTKDELDTEPLADALLERGCTIGLPVVEKRKAPLAFRVYAAGARLVQGRFGIMTPDADAEPMTPDIIVVPLVAFDASGRRLGYGGGYYDRTLAALRAQRPVIAVGYAFAGQEVDGVPAGAHDEPMDWIVTERAAVRVAV